MTSYEKQEGFEQGTYLTEQQFYHAALEEWTRLENLLSEGHEEDYARIYDEIGKVYIQMANIERGLEFFSKAAGLSSEPQASLLYRAHIALAYDRLGQHDRAQRLHTQLIAQAEKISLLPALRGYLHGNQAYLQARNGFYQEAIDQTLLALQHFESINHNAYTADLYTNLGFLLIEIEHYREAETYLQAACGLYEEPLPAMTELCRLYLVRHQYEKSAFYAEQTLDLIWSSFINFEKEEIARLCHLLGRLAYQYGEPQLALRLVEKAQLLFGQIGLWHEWSRVQSVMDEWQSLGTRRQFPYDAKRIQQLTQFVLLLDAMHSQEIIQDHFSALLDTRVLYVRALAKSLGFREEDEQHLVYASRFADYGLTALEPEVALNPYRSKQAFNHYKTHPILSVKMLEEIQAPERVQRIILDHHERYDGSGYPYGKLACEIEPLSRALAIADVYATGVIVNGQSHSEVIKSLTARHSEFDPAMLNSFINLFKQP